MTEMIKTKSAGSEALDVHKPQFEKMVWLPGGTFLMGSDKHYPEEAPAHEVSVDGFWMDTHSVTNEEFRRFVEATKYVTSAERPPNPDDYPGAKPELLVPASVVFQKPKQRVDLNDCYQWWIYVPGANWRHPEGPASSLKGRAKHPVVQLAYEDVEAYARWIGKELPTEAEWEFAARGGLAGAEFVWGDEFTPGPDAYNHYAVGWAHAMDTPYQWTKQVASHWGGTRNGTIVHWPKGIKATAEIRSQFCHVIDIAPTILEAAGIPEPTVVNSVQQSPLEGTSMVYSFDDEKAPERHDLQYFEMFCNRGIYYKGWSAVTRHSTPWVIEKLSAFDDDVWELYDGSKDWTQAHDLSKRMPEKLRDLQRLWLIEATKYNVIPLDDRRVERFNADIAGRPQLVKGNSQLLFGGMGRLSENSVVVMKNKSFSITAEVDVPEKGAEGVIIAQGGKFGGLSLYAKGGKAKFAYNFFGLEIFATEASEKIPTGKHQVRMEFKYDGGGLAKGGNVTLYYDGQKVGEGRIERTVPMLFSADETTDIGREAGTPVTPDYDRHSSVFSGKINWVQIDLGKDDADHFISPEERLRVAMARQ